MIIRPVQTYDAMTRETGSYYPIIAKPKMIIRNVRTIMQLWILIVLSLPMYMSRILGKLTYGLILEQHLPYRNKLINRSTFGRHANFVLQFLNNIGPINQHRGPTFCLLKNFFENQTSAALATACQLWLCSDKVTAFYAFVTQKRPMIFMVKPSNFR